MTVTALHEVHGEIFFTSRLFSDREGNKRKKLTFLLSLISPLSTTISFETKSLHLLHGPHAHLRLCPPHRDVQPASTVMAAVGGRGGDGGGGAARRASSPAPPPSSTSDALCRRRRRCRRARGRRCSLFIFCPFCRRRWERQRRPSAWASLGSASPSWKRSREDAAPLLPPKQQERRQQQRRRRRRRRQQLYLLLLLRRRSVLLQRADKLDGFWPEARRGRHLHPEAAARAVPRD